MSRLRRPIHGPDGRTERPETYRPVRVGAERWADFLLGVPAAFLLGGGAAACLAVPALIPLAVPAGLTLTGAVLARRTRLPLRLPVSAKRRDPGHLAPGRKGFRRAAGTFYLGTDTQTAQEIWLAPADATEHLSFSGGTGSGKTAAQLGWCANALAQGSGFIFVDGKGDAKLAALAMALCRRAGRETDFRVVNFMVASGDRDSNSFNPFRWASADAIREMLVAQISDAGVAGDGNGAVFMDGARALLGALAPILKWLEHRHGFRIDIHSIAEATEFDVVTAIAYDRVFKARDHRSGEVARHDLADMPEALVSPIRAYLGERGGYDEDLHRGRRTSDEPAKQHSFVKLYFAAAFNQMRVSLGHIFGSGTSDINMRDVAVNRRVLLVRLPALENSGKTTAALGKLAVAALRGMMAEALGGRLEGDYAEIVASRPTAAPTPYVVDLDELAAFVAPGNDLVLQQARELNFAVSLGWHDVEGLESKIGGAAGTLLNNTTTSVWMRQNAGGKTRALLESSVGDADVTQLTRYDTGGGAPAEARSVEVRRTARVDWRDTREQEAGEAIVVRGNRRIYARLFHADVDPRGPMRLNRPVALEPPAPGECRAAADALDAVRAALGAPLPRKPPEPPPDFAALVAGLRTAEAAGMGRHEAAEAAVLAVGAAPYAPRPVPPAGGAPPRTAFTPALAGQDAAAPAPQKPMAAPPVADHAAALADAIAEIERMLGADPAEAAKRARRVVAERDAALDPARLPKPPAMDAEELRALLREVIRDFGGDAG